MEKFDIYSVQIDPDTGKRHDKTFIKTVNAKEVLKEISYLSNLYAEYDPNFEIDYEPHKGSREERILQMKEHLQAVYEIAEDLGYDNIFYNEGFAELLLAEKLGHTWNSSTQGPDAWLPNKQTAEYKTAKIGGSFQFHWLSQKKMKKMQDIDWVYFAVRDKLEFHNVHRIPMSTLLPLLEQSSEGIGSEHKSFSQTDFMRMGAEPAPEIYSK